MHIFAFLCYLAQAYGGWAEREAVLPRLSLARVIIVLAVAAAGYFVFSAVGDTLLSAKLSKDQQQLHGQIDQLQQQKDELTSIRDYLQTDQYVEGVARQVLGLVRPGQKLFVVASDAAPTPAAPSSGSAATPQPWWERIFSP